MRSSIKQKILFLTLVFLTMLSGCMSISREHLSVEIDKDELSDHVHFLADRRLKGRAPRSWESKTVRKYINSRYESYGLVPWGNSETYNQKFKIGTNVVGVLPGSDPNLADEIIILTAHYDHLGRGKKGIYVGACDNASGVAALLEIAEQLSLAEFKPKRSICFASFDCEEMMTLGSFAFTCRDDFDKSKIAAVINVDLLGREFMDIMENSLFVVGTEKYPQLRNNIVESGNKRGIDILPVSTDIVGPRGDHVAFETLNVPVLFFTCGLYKDYHKVTDTPDRIYYEKMTRSTKVIAQTVTDFANAETIEVSQESDESERSSLQTLVKVFETILANGDRISMTAKQAESLGALIEEATKLIDTDGHNVKDWYLFKREAVKQVMPILALVDSSLKEIDQQSLWLYEFYTGHREVLTEAMRQGVKYFLGKKIYPIGRLKFQHKVYDLSDDDLVFRQKDNGLYELHLIQTQISMGFNIRIFLGMKGGLGMYFNFRPFSCVGTKDEIVDYCLLKWRANQLDSSYSKTWEKVIENVTEQPMADCCRQYVQSRIKEKGFANEQQWILQLAQSPNPDLAEAAIYSMKEIDGGYQAISRLIEDRNFRPDVREAAIRRISRYTNRSILIPLINVLDDETLYHKKEDIHSLQESYPFKDTTLAVLWDQIIESIEKQYQAKKDETISDVALEKLKELTGKDFDKDKDTWLDWISKNNK